jgi:hypothetical protein
MIDGELNGTISAVLFIRTGYVINDEIIRQRAGVENRQVRKQLRRFWEAGETEELNDKGEDY